MPMPSPRTAAFAAAAIAVLGLGAIWLAGRPGGDGDPFAPCRASQVAGGNAAIGGPFELVDAQGRTVTEADVITEPALIYFGYTFCPDVCPMDVARNADAVDILESRGQIVTPVFITVDPDRDTPAVVGEFAASLHERMIGLSGSPEQVQAAAQAYKAYAKAHKGQGEYYLVDHSTFSYLVLPDHGFVEFFRRDLAPEAMADRI